MGKMRRVHELNRRTARGGRKNIWGAVKAGWYRKDALREWMVRGEYEAVRAKGCMRKVGRRSEA
jgi:hypothetical protein